ncbi:MAG TPA: hypothetical protein VLE93_03545 [Candidatus Saccharimonadales bacterium]|nr:hypothetical protein [Candidatus Saccharimonadales bacterium]
MLAGKIKPQKFNIIIDGVLLIGCLFSLAALFAYIQVRNSPLQSTNLSVLDTSTLTERRLAIASALKNGQKSYTYNSNYIPGIGHVADSTNYLKSWQTAVASKFPSLTTLISNPK